MVRSTTGPESFSFNVATGTRGSPDILTYHGLCEECDGNLNTRGEDKAGKDLDRLAKNFTNAWRVKPSRVPYFFYAMFSISWRILAVSGQAAHHLGLWWEVLKAKTASSARMVSKPVLAQALYLGPYHQLTIFDDSVGQLLSDIQWDGLRILNAQFPLRVKRSIDRTRSTVLTHTFNQLLRQAIPHLVRAPSHEQSQNQPVFHYTSDIVMNLVPESDWYVDFPNGIRLVNTGKFRPFSDSLRVREWHGDRLVLMVHVFQ
ncbi:hypothetical protein WJX82_005962 [Trebouxia sp. C0006]